MNIQSIHISPSEINFSYDKEIFISYQTFGAKLSTQPIILVNHALTGNSSVIGKNGWWNELIGENKTINTNNYSIIAFDIPGNGFHIKNEIQDYQKFSTRIIAQLFWKALEKLNIVNLFCVIGGSLGGSIAWEMAFLKPRSIELIVPIACTNKASDWLIGNVFVQESILNNSSKPIEDARMHAMLLYRTPESLNEKFNLKKDSNGSQFMIENWLNFHGNQLKDRFKLTSYKLMNHLLKTIGSGLNDFLLNDFLNQTNSKIHIISVDSDYMFTEKEQFQTYQKISENYKEISFNSIKSIHGHDAFLIEFKQLHHLLNHHFTK